MRDWARFAPAALLALGVAVQLSRPASVHARLKRPLAELPMQLDGFAARDIRIDTTEVLASGVDTYVMRAFSDSASDVFSLYVGFHSAQNQDNQVHSPRSCLPGAGWQILTSESRATPNGRINRYLLELNGTRALVFYWYQGRGRVEANELSVKLQLLHDAAMTGRTEEAVVRLLIPIQSATAKADAAGLTEKQADALGMRTASALIPRLWEILP